jgi:hypothetical protein
VTVNGNGDYSTPTGFSPTAAGTYWWTAVYTSGNANNNGASSTCGAESVVITSPPPVSQITPTQTTCAQFSGGTAGTLGTITYSTKTSKGTTTISQVAPGVFFYWVGVKAAVGSNSFTISQSQSTASNPFLIAAGSNVYTGSCSTVQGAKITQTGGNVGVTFNATTAGTYYIGLKFSTSNVNGETAPVPSTVVYTFVTSNTAGSTSTVSLQHK